jgi:hypothetical protein
MGAGEQIVVTNECWAKDGVGFEPRASNSIFDLGFRLIVVADQLVRLGIAPHAFVSRIERCRRYNDLNSGLLTCVKDKFSLSTLGFDICIIWKGVEEDAFAALSCFEESLRAIVLSGKDRNALTL